MMGFVIYIIISSTELVALLEMEIFLLDCLKPTEKLCLSQWCILSIIHAENIDIIFDIHVTIHLLDSISTSSVDC
jgi:hypothetical protein